jgi:hypothetical protein
MIPAVSQEDTFAVPSIANTIAIRILRSPLNGLLSHNTLLLSFQGRKSGKTYTIPLRYAQEADTVLCFTHRVTLGGRTCAETPRSQWTSRVAACQAMPPVREYGSPPMARRTAQILHARPGLLYRCRYE